MLLKGRINDIRPDGSVTITAELPLELIIRRKVSEVYIDPIDSRPLSDRQRRMCYALIGAIAEWSGSTREEIKEAFKLEFWAEHIETLADKVFSLSNAPMSLVAEFQRFLISFILSNDVPVKRPLREYVDDISHYAYMCLVHRKCAVCGRRGELHHLDVIGMGNDRKKVSHLGREALSLCREHHAEYHTLGRKEFMGRYHFDGGVKIDEAICRIYGLRK